MNPRTRRPLTRAGIEETREEYTVRKRDDENLTFFTPIGPSTVAHLCDTALHLYDENERLLTEIGARAETVDWLRLQIAGCIDYARTLEQVTDLAITRALIFDLSKALDALNQSAFTEEESC